MARGYQARWQNVLCQRFGVTSTASDGGDADQRNRLLFSENFKIMKKAWADDLLTYDGPTYQVPYPYDTGIPNWPPAKTITGPYGVPGEVDDDGTIRGMGVVPKPYTSPHPQLFQAFGASPGTLQWCGEENVTPTILMGDRQILKQLMEIYQEGAASSGSQPRVRRGHRRLPDVLRLSERHERRTPSTRRSRRACASTRSRSGAGWYEQFGFMEGARLLGEEGPVPGPDESLKERLTKSGLLIGGTVDDVKRQVESFLQELPIDYFVWLFHWGMIPREEALPMMELFATEIMPEFGMDASSLEAAAAGA